MKNKEYVYIGEPLPELNWQEHAQFLTHLEKAVLYSLEKRVLISRSERERCFIEIDALHAREKRQT